MNVHTRLCSITALLALLVTAPAAVLAEITYDPGVSRTAGGFGTQRGSDNHDWQYDRHGQADDGYQRDWQRAPQQQPGAPTRRAPMTTVPREQRLREQQADGFREGYRHGYRDGRRDDRGHPYGYPQGGYVPPPGYGYPAPGYGDYPRPGYGYDHNYDRGYPGNGTSLRYQDGRGNGVILRDYPRNIDNNPTRRNTFPQPR